jgi:Zn-dependent protease
VAKARGLPVRSITLFALGGVASIEKGAADANTEFWMGIAGPLTSVGIGIVCTGLAVALGWGMNVSPGNPAMAALVWLGYINFMVAAFNGAWQFFSGAGFSGLWIAFIGWLRTVTSETTVIEAL